MAPKTHSKYGASKMSRIFACPGSANLEEKFPNITTPDAKKGTCAHRVGEKCFLNNNNPEAYLDTDVLLEDGSIERCDAEMVEAVKVYVDEVRRWNKELSGSVIEVEKEGSLEWLEKDVWGTNDVSIRQFMGTLIVIDYKHGAGVPVDVVKDDGSINPQLMQYALQALGAPPKNGVENYEEIIVGIVQPRSFHPDGPIRYAPPMTPEQLREWGNNVLKPGVKAAKKRNAPLNPGEHCRFCRAAQGCPAIHKQATETAIMAFGGDLENANPIDPVIMSPEDISKVLKMEKILTGWLKAVSARALTMLGAGEEIPGFKLVKKKTHRKWNNVSDTLAALVGVGIDLDLILTPRKLLTPAQVEKVLKDAKIKVEGLESLYSAPNAATIAPITDKRPVFIPTNPADLFGEIESEE